MSDVRGGWRKFWLIIATEGEREDKACTKPFDAGIKSLCATQHAEILFLGILNFNAYS